jgi:hypothetical protein
MRKTGYFTSFVLGVVTLVGFCTMNVDNVYGQGSPVYFGEHCWEGGGGVLTLGMTHMGDGHISFCGLATRDPYEWAINGNLEVVGNSVVMTSTEAATLLGGNFMFSRIADAALDLSTMDGTANFMEMNWNDGIISFDHYSIDLTYIDCGSDQSSDGVDKREELIKFLRMYSTTPEDSLD